MFVAYSNFRRLCGGNEIKDYKGFYKEFSGKIEFGGCLTNYDHLIRDRFANTFSPICNTILRKQPERILDLGCGNGVNLPFSRVFPWIGYYGLDYAEATVKRANAEFPNVKFGVADAFKTCFKDKSFDLIILSSILLLYKEERDQAALLTEAKRILKDDGVLVLVVWSEAILLKASIQMSRFLANIFKCNSLKDFMCVYFSKKDITRLAKVVNFQIEEKVFTGENFGVLESIKYLNLSKYQRIYGKSDIESNESHPQNILKDLIGRLAYTNKYFTTFLFMLAKINPKWFSNFGIYILTKK